MKRSLKGFMHLLLALVLFFSAFSPGIALANGLENLNSAMDEQDEENVRQLMNDAMALAEKLSDPDPKPKNHKRVEYTLFELQAAVDGNFETDNAIISPRFFEHSEKALHILKHFKQIAPEEKDPVIETVISANRLAANKLLELIEKNASLFTEKDRKYLEKAHKYYQKGLDFETKNNREQSIHFYEKSWGYAQKLKEKGKDRLDSDGDGLIDEIEDKLGTNKHEKDTDGDGLLDGFEVLKLNTSPLAKDTDKNGVPDGEEDPDQDGLTNLQEQEAGTNPVQKDTDSDGLDDRFELQEFGTSPLIKDTDHDGLDDGGEYRVGTNPNKKYSGHDKLYDGLRIFPQTFTEKESGAILEISGKGDLSQAVKMSDVSDQAIFKDVPGAVSPYVDIHVNKEFESATVKFPINESAVPNGDVDNVKMAVYDKEEGKFTVLEKQNVENGFVVAEADHFSVFVLVYTPDWEKAGNMAMSAEASALSFSVADAPDEEDPGEAPKEKDSDGDGLSDREEQELGTLVYYHDTDMDGLNDGIEVDLGYDPFEANIDGDSYSDLEEYNEGLDPYDYDKDWLDYVQEVLLGASVNEFGETLVDWGWMDEETFNSIPYLLGQLVAGYLVYGDIVDFVANMTQVDIVDGLLAAVGVIPVVGDGAKTIAKIVQFAKRTTKNLPKAYRMIIDEFENSPKILAAALDAVSNGASQAMRKMGASDNMIAHLGKRKNDLAKISKMKGVKFADEVLSEEIKQLLNGRIQKHWGKNLSKKDEAEAFATEAAIHRYEQQGYTLLYAQRPMNKTVRTVTGPDIIMKTPSGEPFIIEAKGSYATGKKSRPELHDGKKKGVRLASRVGGQYRLYLSRDWLTTNRERYMDAFEDAILKKTIRPEEKEAYNMLKDIMDGGKKYKSSVVFGGVKGSKVKYGYKIDEYLDELLKDTDAIDLVQILG